MCGQFEKIEIKECKYIIIWPKFVAVGRIDNDLVLFRIFGSKPLP